MRYFKVAKGFETEGINLPKRGTRFSAGYDFESAKEIVVPSIWKAFGQRIKFEDESSFIHFDDVDYTEIEKGFHEDSSRTITTPAHIKIEEIEDRTGFKPTLVPTGVKANMFVDEYLQLANRSSNPKKGLVLANGIGVIDKDYFENEDNDGHIFFAFFNFSENDYVIKKHDKIGQGIFHKYLLTSDDTAKGIRNGGFGSTGN